MQTWTTDDGIVETSGGRLSPDRLHLILPASNGAPRLCKSMLAQAILGYPAPNLVMWNQTFTDDRLLGNGSHLVKISSTLAWLNEPSNYDSEDDLVVMADAYDVWFQLPPETLIARYHRLVANEDQRIRRRLGSRAYEAEKLSARVIFSASKRCGPNDPRSVACYAVPESPLPRNVFGRITDTIYQHNRWAGLRQQHLVSGFIIGPVKDMRRIFARANENMEKCLAGDMKGTKWIRPRCHGGSDQSFFNEMFGWQEFHRELMRRHHRTSWERFFDRLMPWRAGAPPRPHVLEAEVVDDPIDPSFEHMPMPDRDYHPDQPHEFGITVDYFSELSHQTSNALHDTAFVRHDQPLRPQTDNPAHGQDILCRPHAPMPNDIFPGTGGLELFDAEKRPRWDRLPLYSEVCAGTVPIAVHHNWVNKKPIDALWPDMWWTGNAKMLLDARREQAAGDQKKLAGGAVTDTGETLSWDDLCPAEWNEEVFLEK